MLVAYVVQNKSNAVLEFTFDRPKVARLMPGETFYWTGYEIDGRQLAPLIDQGLIDVWTCKAMPEQSPAAVDWKKVGF